MKIKTFFIPTIDGGPVLAFSAEPADESLEHFLERLSCMKAPWGEEVHYTIKGHVIIGELDWDECKNQEGYVELED